MCPDAASHELCAPVRAATALLRMQHSINQSCKLGHALDNASAQRWPSTSKLRGQHDSHKTLSTVYAASGTGGAGQRDDPKGHSNSNAPPEGMVGGSKMNSDGSHYAEYEYDYEWTFDSNGNEERTRGEPSTCLLAQIRLLS